MKSLAIGTGVVLGLEALIFLLIGAIPPTITVHWYLVGFGLGLPAGLLLLGVLIGLLLNKLGFTAPADAGSYLNQRYSVHTHSTSTNSPRSDCDAE